MKHSYDVSGMHCESCIKKITEKLKSVDQVLNVNVDLKTAVATVEMKEHIPTARLNEVIKTAGDYSFKEKLSPISEDTHTADDKQSLKPLFIIFAYIVGGVFLAAQLTGDFSLHSLMGNFMGAFFVLFSLFKMIDLSGFADGYSTYDVLAKRTRAYALSYPFIELGLGILYFLGLAPFFTNLFTMTLMAVGAVGVGKALLEKRTIQCACLGTSLKLPMTKVTLAEDVLMGAMAGVMLLGV